MTTKSVSSTKAQNNFGRVLDDVTHNHTRYIVERRGVPQVVILSFDDFAHILNDEKERQQIDTVLKDLRPKYQIGKIVSSAPHSE
jgi:prevent-host-death family protein